MTDATTPNYGWSYPTVNADADTWGTTLNATIVAIDASLKTVDNGLAARLVAANNLSDVANAATARTNLGLGTAAVSSSTEAGSPLAAVINFGAAEVAVFGTSPHANGSLVTVGLAVSNIMRCSNNLSDITNSATARTQLGLGSIATHNVTISSGAPSGGSDGDIWLQYT